MKALILDGGQTATPIATELRQALTGLLTAAHWQVETAELRSEKVGYCLGCFECWVKTPGVCRIDDDGRDVAAEVIQSDLVIFLTPITFGGYSSHLKKVVDRLIPLISPFFKQIDGEVHHHARYDRYPTLLGVGTLPQPDAEQAQIFSHLIERNSINLHAPRQASFVATGSQFDPQQLSAALASVLPQPETNS